MCRIIAYESCLGLVCGGGQRMVWCMVLVAVAIPSGGCVSAVGIGVKLVGKAVDTADVQKREQELIGADLSAAAAMFGKHLDTLRDVGSDRSWVIYPVESDLLDKDRYVVEVADAKIVALSRTEKNSDPKRDFPRALIMKRKIKGKTPEQCAAELDMGEPVLAVRSDETGLLSQIYDARHFKEWGSPDYCILRFDERELCMEVEFLGIGASTKKEPLHT